MSQCERYETCALLQMICIDTPGPHADLLREYCRGPRADACARKRFRQQHGVPPADALMPTGEMLDAAR